MEAEIPVIGLKRPPRKPVPWLVYYTGVCTLLGLSLTLRAITNLPEDYGGLLLFAVLAGLAELTSVELFVTSRQSRVSVSSMIAIASILVFGPLAGVLTHAVSGIMTIITTTFFSQLPEKGRVAWYRRAMFNIGMLVTAAALAGWIYKLAGGTPGAVNLPGNIFPLLAATTVDTLANLAILIGVLTLQTGRRPGEIWSQNFQWAAPIAVVGGVLGGGALALAYQLFGLLGLVVFFLPVITTSYSFRLYVGNTRAYVDRLEGMNRELDHANMGLLETLAAVIDAYDAYTAGHSSQVAVYTAALADLLEIPEADRERYIKAALVHDIGKVGIMDTIISKQGPLTTEEYNIVKRHTIIGAEIVGHMPGLKDLVPLVRYHHEHWNGKGYPDGISGEKIPLGARILAVADALDTQLSDRPYRETKSFHAVVTEMERCSGTQFDPQVIDAFKKLVETRGSEFFTNSASLVDKSLFSNSFGAIYKNMRYVKKGMLAEACDV